MPQLTVPSTNQRLNLPRRRSQPFRIGIAGCGPRGLYCLESLARQLSQLDIAPKISITVFEPTDALGAGNVYHPSQPNYLRMNFAAKHVCVWSGPDEHADRRLDLVRWHRSHSAADFDSYDFVSRATVGEYLHDCFRQVVAELRQSADVNIQKQRVRSCHRQQGGPWRVVADHSEFDFDELVLTVGHEGWRPPPQDDHDPEADFPPVFPVTKYLNQDSIKAGSHVAVRGFGLTCIDAVLGLTEGRGGEFSRTQYAWKYQPSGREPRSIFPYSRSGRPMLAKPDKSLFNEPAELDDLWAEGRQTIDQISRPVDYRALLPQVWNAVTSAAASALNCYANGCPITPSMVQGWFENWCRMTIRPYTSYALMEQSFAVATGRTAADVGWALGASWRNLYPALVRCVSYGGLAADAWPTFRFIAAEMERIAFGPSSENVGKLLALVDRGLVDLRFLTGKVEFASRSDQRARKITNGQDSIVIDHGVNAVLPSPLHLSENGPLYHLLNTGQIEKLHGSIGIRVDQSGRPLIGDNRPVEGLAIFGRATEGCVLGNDTLSRTPNEPIQAWAAAVATRINQYT